MKRSILVSFLISVLGFTAYCQTNTFPADGSAGVGTTSPQVWFEGKVFELRAPRPVLRFSPLEEGGLATIVFKGGYDETPGTHDEFHLNYASSRTSPSISLGGYMYGGNILTIMGNGNLGIGTSIPTVMSSYR